MTREEAIKVAIEMHGWLQTDREREALKTLIPELRDSEDERIRKDIINLINWLKANPSLCSQYYKDRYDRILAWLERQKEEEGYETIPVESTLEYKLGFKAGRESVEKPFNVCEQCPYYKDCPDYNEKKQEWSEDDERIAKEIEEELWYPGDFPDYPSKEESELYDDCQRRLNWFKNKIKSFRLQKLDASKLENFDPVEVLNRIKTEWPMAWEKVVGKQEWSEEDEKIWQSIIKDIEFERNYTLATTGRGSEKYNEQINWLKVLSLNRKKINEGVEKLCSNEWSEEDEKMLDEIFVM